jgi:hypothetical protein
MNVIPTARSRIARSYEWLRLLAVPAVFASAGLAALGVAAFHVEPTKAADPVEAAARQAQTRADAVEAFREGRWAAAYGRYAELADGGDATAAQIALVMLRNGHELFGSDWSATPGQQARWATMVVGTARSQAPIPGGEGRE